MPPMLVEKAQLPSSALRRALATGSVITRTRPPRLARSESGSRERGREDVGNPSRSRPRHQDRHSADLPHLKSSGPGSPGRSVLEPPHMLLVMLSHGVRVPHRCVPAGPSGHERGWLARERLSPTVSALVEPSTRRFADPVKGDDRPD